MTGLRQRLSAADAMLAPIIVGVVAVHALLVWSVLSMVARGRAIGDWVSFYAAGTIVREGDGRHLFDVATQSAMQRTLFGDDAVLNFFPLPAFMAMVFAPLSSMSFGDSYFAWLAFNCGLLIVLALLAWRYLEPLPTQARALVTSCLACSLPVVNLLLLGQVDLLVVAGFAGCFALLGKRQPALAGAVLALALVKPHLVAAPLLLLVLRREWRALAGFGAVAAPLVLLPALMLGPETLLDQIALLQAQSSAASEGRVNPEMMANMRGLIVSVTRVTSPWVWAPPTLIAGVAAIVAASLSWRRMSVTEPHAWAIACLSPLVYSPHLHVHALALGAMAFCLYVRARFDAGGQISATRVVLCFAGATVLWIVSVAGVSLLGLAVLGGFVMTVREWPRDHGADRPRAATELLVA